MRELASILDGTWSWSVVDASKLSDGGLSATHAREFAKRVPPYLAEARRRADEADVGEAAGAGGVRAAGAGARVRGETRIKAR